MTEPVTVSPAISELFNQAPPCTHYNCVGNSARKDGRPYKLGWSKTITDLLHVVDILDSGWIEHDPTKVMMVICPAEFEPGKGEDFDRRLLANNPKVSMLGLDFDNQDSVPLAVLVNALSGFDGFYYTTKSHQKSKHGITCDRYRVFVAYSRPVTHDENRRIHNLLAGVLGHDASCGDATRLFYPSVKGCLYGKLGGTAALDVDHLLRICDARGITAHRSGAHRSKAYARVLHSTLFTPAVSNAGLARKIGKLWKQDYEKKCKTQKFNTRDAVYRLMREAMKHLPNPSVVLATFESMPWYNSWIRRHPGEDSRPRVLEAFADVVCDAVGYHGDFAPLIEQEEVDRKGLPPLSPEYKANLDGYRAMKGYTASPLQDDTHRLVCEVAGKCRVILAIPCGLGKSEATIIYAQSYATSDKPVWIILDTHRRCVETVTTLRQLGVKVEYFCGFHDEKKECINPAKNPLDMYDGKRCRKCTRHNVCAFGRRITQKGTVLRAQVVVMTHAMFIRLLPWSSTRKEYTLQEPVVFADEQLRRWTTLTLSPGDLSTIERILGCTDLQYESNRTFGKDKYTGTRRCRTSHVRYETLRCVKRMNADPNITDEDIELCMEYLQFFAGEKTRFMIQTSTPMPKGERSSRLSLVGDRIELDLPHSMIMLDASARYTRVQWPGFKVLTMSSGLDYANVTVVVHKGTATRASLRRDTGKKYVAACKDEIKKRKLKHVLWARTKNDGLTIQLSRNDKTAWRGTDTRASNAFLDCSTAVIVEALFTTLSTYALEASLATGEEIPKEAIWRKNGAAYSPNIDKNGFTDPKLHAAFVRQVLDEVYQAAMRIGIRKYDNKPYTVFCRLPSWNCVLELRKMLPGIKVEPRGFGKIPEIYALSTTEVLEKGNTILGTSNNAAVKTKRRERFVNMVAERTLEELEVHTEVPIPAVHNAV